MKRVLWIGVPAFLLLLTAGETQEPDMRETTLRMVEKVLKSSSQSLVGLEIVFKKKSRLELAEEDLESEEPFTLRELRENRQSLSTFGVSIDSEGTVLAPDAGLPLNDVESIAIVTQDGRRVEAEIASLLVNYAGLTIRPMKKSDATFTPVTFKETRARPEDFPPGSYYYAAFMEFMDGTWHVNVSPYIVTNRPAAKSDELILMDQIRWGSLVTDERGEPIGLALDAFLWKNSGGRDSFVGQNILKDERIEFAKLKEKYKEVEAALLKQAYKVELLPRDDRDSSQGLLGSASRSAKIVHIGIPVGNGGLVFVPRDLPVELVKKIEEITVAASGGANHPASFAGLYKDLGGYLVRCDALKDVPAAVDVRSKDFLRGRLFLSVFFEERFGKVSARVKHGRAMRIVKGLNDRPKYQPLSPIRAGSFLADLHSSSVGFCTVEKKEEELEDHSFSRYGDALMRRPDAPVRETMKKLYLFGQVEDLLSRPDKHFNKQAMPMSKKEEQSLVWLGVEFQEIGKPLADELGVQKQTRDGKKGLLVTDVFPDSPAEKLGLRPDDILLSLRVEETSDMIDLVLDDRSLAYSQLSRLYSSRRSPTEAMLPWRPRRNYLSTLLTKIGAGKKVTLAYVRDKKDLTADLALSGAPPDFDSAEKYKADELGITVKELTYEVRHYQKLGRDFPGVIVSRIEPGSRAEIAKLTSLTIIKNINHERVRGLAHFKELIETFKKSQLRSLTLELVNLGQTRFVDIPRE